MQILDIVLLLGTIFFVVIGIKRGFIGEIVRLAAMVAGVVVAFLYFKELAVRIHFLHLPRYFDTGISFVLIYLATMLVIIGIGWVVRKAVQLSMLGWLDRLLGGVAGIVKMLLIAWVVCLSISSLPPRSRSGFYKSIVYKTYEKLPSEFSISYLLRLREQCLKYIDHDAAANVKGAQKTIATFKDRVDSAQGF